MRRRMMAALMAAAMAGTLLAGCGSGSSSTAATEAETVLEETESVAEEAASADTEAAEDAGDTAGQNTMNDINADPYQIEAESRLDPDTALTLRILSVDGLTITADKLELALFDADAVAAAKAGETLTALDGMDYNVLDANDCTEVFGDDEGNDALVEIQQSSVNPEIMLERNGQYAYPLDTDEGIVAFPLVSGDGALLDTVEQGKTYELAEDAEVTVLKEDFSTVTVDPAEFANVSYENGYMTSAAGMLVRVNIGDGTIATLTQVYTP